MLTEYYLLHSWNPESGFPKKERMRELRIKRYVDLLQKREKSLRISYAFSDLKGVIS